MVPSPWLTFRGTKCWFTVTRVTRWISVVPILTVTVLISRRPFFIILVRFMSRFMVPTPRFIIGVSVLAFLVGLRLTVKAWLARGRVIKFTVGLLKRRQKVVVVIVVVLRRAGLTLLFVFR